MILSKYNSTVKSGELFSVTQNINYIIKCSPNRKSSTRWAGQCWGRQSKILKNHISGPAFKPVSCVWYRRAHSLVLYLVQTVSLGQHSPRPRFSLPQNVLASCTTSLEWILAAYLSACCQPVTPVVVAWVVLLVDWLSPHCRLVLTH